MVRLFLDIFETVEKSSVVTEFGGSVAEPLPEKETYMPDPNRREDAPQSSTIDPTAGRRNTCNVLLGMDGGEKSMKENEDDMAAGRNPGGDDFVLKDLVMSLFEKGPRKAQSTRRIKKDLLAMTQMNPLDFPSKDLLRFLMVSGEFFVEKVHFKTMVSENTVNWWIGPPGKTTCYLLLYRLDGYPLLLKER